MGETGHYYFAPTLVVSHGNDIDLTDMLVEDTSSYTLVWQKVTDPYDKEIGWAGGWVRFLENISKRADLVKNSIFLLNQEDKEKNKALIEKMEQALIELNFKVFHADTSEVENEISTQIPFNNDFEIIGEKIFKIISPAGSTYRSQEGVRLILKDLSSDYSLRRLTRYVFEVAGCEYGDLK